MPRVHVAYDDPRALIQGCESSNARKRSRDQGSARLIDRHEL